MKHVTKRNKKVGWFYLNLASDYFARGNNEKGYQIREKGAKRLGYKSFKHMVDNTIAKAGS